MISTTDLLNIIDKNKNLTIEQLFQYVPDITFGEYLETLLLSYNFSKSDIIKNSTLNRTYAYQIFNNSKHPSKDKVIQIALAMHLNLDETNNLLALSNSGSLYPKVKRDALIIFGLSHKLTLNEVNELLYDYHLNIIE